MTEERLALGKKGEEIAAAFLKKSGYRIKERNYRSPLGEIDIIATEKKTIVFVEVKTRSSTFFGHPSHAVGKHKQRQLIKTALYYLAEKRLERNPARFDVVSIIHSGNETTTELIKNAFDAPS